MSKIDEFKIFVKKHPELINYVHSNGLTWQNLYENWIMYGEDEKVWSKYKESAEQTASPVTDLMNMVKGVNINNLSKNITTIQKAISLAQEIIKKDEPTKTEEPYTPRPLYRRFED